MRGKITAAMLALCMSTSCAVVHRHPVVAGAVTGAAVGLTVALVTRHNCPKIIDGVPYDGTPPCPKYWPDTPGGKK